MNENSAAPKCARCGATVATDAPDGLCPRCLIALNFVTETEIPGEEGGSAGTQVMKAAAPPAPPPQEIAQLFPQFEVLECLGRGGMGAVYKARQPKLDRCVALKILLRRREDGSADLAFAQRFAREARALARLNHPNIVAVYDYGEAGGYPFLVMEYVEGLTLRQLLQRGKLAPEEALAIVPKICEALQFAHEKGIVHRDIKPENILLDKSGQVKITDFGIAKIIAPGAPDHSLTGAKDVVGTPHYMAPEQVEQPQRVDHRADIYSLGVVFYEMLTGELPLGKFQPPSSKVQIDGRLDEVVLRALAKEPERRYQQASQVKTAVETITMSESAAIPKASAAPSPGPERTRGAWNKMAGLARWTARILGTVWALMLLVFVIAEGSPPLVRQPAAVQVEFVAMGLMLLGFVVGWWKDGPAALLTLGGWTLFHLAEQRARLWSLFQVSAAVGVLYGISWAMRRKASPDNGRAGKGAAWALGAGVAAFLALALALLWMLNSAPRAGTFTCVVTDAATGKPVANAEVTARHVRFFWPSATRTALTGAEGRCQLLAWAGRTVLQAKAPGYGPSEPVTTLIGPDSATRWIGLKRYLESSGSHPHHFRLQPGKAALAANSPAPFLARLPHGTVELVGISRHPSKDQPWWAPDGSPLPARAWEVDPNFRLRAPDTPESHLPYVFRQFVLQAEGDAELPRVMGVAFDGEPGANGGFNIDLRGQKLAGWDGVLKSFKAGQSVTTLRVAMASDAFAPAPESTVTRFNRQAMAGRVNDKRFVVSEVFERDGRAAFNLSVDVAEMEYRLRATDSNGRQHLSRIVEGKSTGGLIQEVRVFDGLRVHDIREVVFETRPYAWVEFRNVALHPGFRTQVQVGPAAGAADNTVGAGSKPAAAAARAFGPVIERVISGEGDTNKRFIDFDTGKQFAAAEFFGPKDEPSPEETRKLWQKTGIDAVGDTSPAVRGLVGFEMVAVPVASEEWDRLAPSRLDYHLALAQPGTPVAMRGKGELPATFVVATRSGGRGVLQILALTDSPPGVKIRYKLLQEGEAPASEPTNRVSGIARTTQAVVQQQVETKLSAMKSRLRLTGDQERSVRDLLGKKLGLAGELSAGMSEGALSQEAMDNADRSIQDIDHQMQEVLTPPQRADYETSQAEERRTQAQLAANVELMELQPVLQLTPTQRDQVLQILSRLHAQQLARSYDGLKIPLDWEQQLADLKEALRPVLTAEQLQSLGTWLDLQRELIKTKLSR